MKGLRRSSQGHSLDRTDVRLDADETIDDVATAEYPTETLAGASG